MTSRHPDPDPPAAALAPAPSARGTSRSRLVAVLVTIGLLGACVGADGPEVDAPDVPSSVASETDEPPATSPSDGRGHGGFGSEAEDDGEDLAAADPEVTDAEPDGPLAADADADAELPPPPPTRDEVVGAAEEALSAALDELGDADLAVLVVDEHGREVLDHEPDTPVLPASTLKIVTAAALLSTLGPDARLLTRVDTTAPIDAEGTVAGDLVVLGSGDPVLATAEYGRWVYPARPRTPLEDLADAVAEAGIRRVEGQLIGASDRFPGPRQPEGWPERYFADFDARYSSGLTVDAGLRTLVTYPEPEPDDDPDSDDPDGGDPDGGDPDGGDGADSGEGGDEGSDAEDADDADAPDPDTEDADDAPDPEDLGPPEVLVDHAPDPAAHAVAELLRLLEERDVEVVGGARTGPPRTRTVGRVATVASPTIEELLRFAVQRSDNQVTDGLFRVAGRVRTGVGSWPRADRALRQVLDRYGVDHEGAVFADGSGLSREDRVTARLLVDLDRAMRGSRHAGVWDSLMAEMGVSGTLSQRLRGTPVQGRFVGKTGTLRDVTGLTGTIRDDDGRSRYHLAVLANAADGHDRWVARVLTDELIVLLVGDVEGCEVGSGGGESVLGRPPLTIAC